LKAALALFCAYLAAITIATVSAHAGTNTQTVKRAICGVFGPYCSQALRVSWCESRWSTSATNGQYLGLFQMGSYARSRYGHGSDAWTQAQAAFRYFADSGYGWGPWSCRP
jgi:hypothetical protein